MKNIVAHISAEFDARPRWHAFVVGLALWSLAYRGNMFLNLFPATDWPMLSFERNIPFVDWTILPYLSVFLQIFLGMWLLQTRRFGCAISAGLVMIAVYGLIFLFWPSYYPREGFEPGGYFAWMYQQMWTLDPPRNCFPSLHVGMAFLAAFSMLGQNRNRGWLFLL